MATMANGRVSPANTLANSEHADEMHFTCVYTTLFAKTKMIVREKKIQFHLKIITCDPSIVQWTIPSLLFQIRGKNLLVLKGLRNIPNQYSKTTKTFWL